MASDGSIIIDTRIDTSGFDDQLHNMRGGVNGLSGAFRKLGGIIATTFAVGTLIKFGKEAIELGSDLQEVQNVVDVTFTTMSDKVNEFAQNAADAAGLSETMAKKYVGLYGTMSKQFGFTEAEAYEMSTALTQLAGDVASYYNITQDEAYTKLKAVYSGETEVLKDIGVVMTQSALNSYAMANGLNMTTKEMTEQQKVALRYNFILDQLSAASGDFVRTSDNWANQMRILRLNIDSLKATIGQGLINIFTPVIKVLNTVISRLATAAKYFKAFTELFTGKQTAGGGGSPGEAASELADLQSGYEGVADATEKATKAQKKHLTGLDEIRTFQDSGTTQISGIGSIGLEEMSGTAEDAVSDTVGLIDELQAKYPELIAFAQDSIATLKSIFNNFAIGDFFAAGQDVSTLVVGINEFFAKAIDDVDWEGIGNNIGSYIAGIEWLNILDSVGELIWEGINAAIEIWKGAFDTAPIETAIVTALMGLKIAGITIPASVKIGLTVVAFAPNIAKAIGEKLGIDETIFGDPLEELDWNYVFEKLQEGFTDESGNFSITAGINFTLDVLKANVIGTSELLGLSDSENPIVRLLFSPTEDVLKELDIGGWIEKNIVQPITEKTNSLRDNVSGIWLDVSRWFNKNVVTPIVKFFEGMWTTVSDYFSHLWEDIKSIWDKVSEWFSKNVIEPVIGFFQGFWTRVQQIFEGLWIIIQAIWIIVSEWFNDNVIEPVVEFFQGLWEDVSGFFSQLWTDIKDIWKKVSGWFDENVIQPVTDFFEGVWEDVSGFFIQLWTDIKSVWKSVSGWFEETVINPVKEAWETATESIGEFFESLWEGIKRGVVNAMNAVIGGIESGINWIIDGINNIIGGFNKVVSWAAKIAEVDWGGVDLVAKVSIPRIPMLATGAVIPPNAPFMAMLGDQKHGTNIEAPLDTIKQAVREVIGNTRQGGGQYAFTAQINRRVLFEEFIEEAKLQQSMTGRNPLDLGKT